MPLVAEHLHHGRVDATSISDRWWRSDIHRRGVALRCPGCRQRMVAAVSSAGLRHFRHYRRPHRCELYGETPTHQAIKRAVLHAVRAIPGWTAEPEVSGPGWRADVLATGPGGRRIAWEAQVSGIGDDTAAERTHRLAASGVEVCWLPTTRRRSLADLPQALITPLRGHGEDRFDVVRHAETFSTTHHGPDGWAPATVELTAFVTGVCRATVFWAPQRPLTDTGAWTTTAHQSAAADEARRRERRRARARAEHHRRHNGPVTSSHQDDAEQRVQRLIRWQQRVHRGWNAPDDPPPW